MTPERVDINARFQAVLIDGMMALFPIMLAFAVGLFFTDMGDPNLDPLVRMLPR